MRLPFTYNNLESNFHSVLFLLEFFPESSNKWFGTIAWWKSKMKAKKTHSKKSVSQRVSQEHFIIQFYHFFFLPVDLWLNETPTKQSKKRKKRKLNHFKFRLSCKCTHLWIQFNDRIQEIESKIFSRSKKKAETKLLKDI